MFSLRNAGVAADNARLVKETTEKLGGIDVIVANAGWTRFSKLADVYDLSYDEWNKVSLDTTVQCHHTATDVYSVGQPMLCPTYNLFRQPHPYLMQTQAVMYT
jgi:hypothetical protein